MTLNVIATELTLDLSLLHEVYIMRDEQKCILISWHYLDFPRGNAWQAHDLMITT